MFIIDAFYENPRHFNWNSWAIDAISRPCDTITGTLIWILCAVSIKLNTVMNIGVAYNESRTFNENSGRFNQNSWAFDAISRPYGFRCFFLNITRRLYKIEHSNE